MWHAGGTAGRYDAAWSDAGQQRPTPLLGLLIRRIGLAFSEYDIGDLFSAGGVNLEQAVAYH